ncbi:hypothetical protein ACFWGN_16095 [Oerskovia sp. NPDC060338]|uniref:hypothetical protein n=1 Tax=Oerskovia sp. NPDC060338 TaxID=3347100 RepID=UPI00365F4174
MTTLPTPRTRLRAQLRASLNRFFARLERATDDEPWRVRREPGLSVETSRPRKFENYERLVQLSQELKHLVPNTTLVFTVGRTPVVTPPDLDESETVLWLSQRPEQPRRRVTISASASADAADRTPWQLDIANVDGLSTHLSTVRTPITLHDDLRRLALEFTVPMTGREVRRGAPVLPSADLRTADQFAHELEVARDAAKIGGRRGLIAGVISGVVSGVATVWATSPSSPF